MSAPDKLYVPYEVGVNVLGEDLDCVDAFIEKRCAEDTANEWAEQDGGDALAVETYHHDRLYQAALAERDDLRASLRQVLDLLYPKCGEGFGTVGGNDLETVQRAESLLAKSAIEAAKGGA